MPYIFVVFNIVLIPRLAVRYNMITNIFSSHFQVIPETHDQFRAIRCYVSGDSEDDMSDCGQCIIGMMTHMYT